MARVFVSHVEEDAALVADLARDIRSAGFTTWLYTEDGVPGVSYLLETKTAIEESGVFLVVLSRIALGSRNIGVEIVRAHEANKPMLPVLVGITRDELAAAQPEWIQALGATVSIATSGGIAAVAPKIVAGLVRITRPQYALAPSPPPRSTLARLWEWVMRLLRRRPPIVRTLSPGDFAQDLVERNRIPVHLVPAFMDRVAASRIGLVERHDDCGAPGTEMLDAWEETREGARVTAIAIIPARSEFERLYAIRSGDVVSVRDSSWSLTGEKFHSAALPTDHATAERLLDALLRGTADDDAMTLEARRVAQDALTIRAKLVDVLAQLLIWSEVKRAKLETDLRTALVLGHRDLIAMSVCSASERFLPDQWPGRSYERFKFACIRMSPHAAEARAEGHAYRAFVHVVVTRETDIGMQPHLAIAAMAGQPPFQGVRFV